MAPRPNVDKLPTEIRDAAYELMRGGKTVDEITAHLKGMGAAVSRSGVGRWKKSAEKSMKALKRASALGAGFAKSLEEDPKGKIGRLLVELGQTAVLDNLLARSDGGEGDGDGDEEAPPVDTKELYFLSMAVKNFESAGTLNTARELKIRQEVIAKAVKAIEKVATAGGMTADTISKLRAAVIGTAA